MVRVSYAEIETSYETIKRAACGRKACSVMILVASEVDAMASARMLAQQLRTDNITYTLRPVTNFSQVQLNRAAFLTDQIKTVFMINCGAVRACCVLCASWCFAFFLSLCIACLCLYASHLEPEGPGTNPLAAAAAES